MISESTSSYSTVPFSKSAIKSSVYWLGQTSNNISYLTSFNNVPTDLKSQTTCPFSNFAAGAL